MSLDLDIYDENKRSINLSLGGVGWIILKYLHDNHCVDDYDIERCFYTTQLNIIDLKEIKNQIINFFKEEPSMYDGYDSYELSHILGIVHEIILFIETSGNIVFLKASW